MDRNFYYQQRAREHQGEISQELVNRHLLNEAYPKPLSVKRARHLVFRLAPAVIVIAILVMLNLHG